MRKLLLMLSVGALFILSACGQEEAAEPTAEDTPAATAEAPKASSTLPPDTSPATVPAEEYASDEAKEYCDNLAQWNKTDDDLLATLIEYNNGLRGIEDDLIAEGCPEYQKVAKQAKKGVFDGSYSVGDDMEPGTYEAMVTHEADGLHDCYWERATGSGDVIDNNFVNFAPDGVTVSVQSGEAFTSEGCGAWRRVD